jgi:Zn finger protein HypA/HybF involved in hydrogenase expression
VGQRVGSLISLQSAWIGAEIDTRMARSLTSNVEGSRISRSGELNVMAEGYCVRCKAKQPIAEAVEEVMKNGRKAVKGKCPVCGVVMFKILGGKATPPPVSAPAAPAAPAPESPMP